MPNRLVTYRDDGAWSAGVAVGDQVVPLRDDDGPPPSVRQLLARGPRRVADACAAAEAAAAAGGGLALGELELGPPLPDPDKIIGLGLNYRQHASEVGKDAPATPTLFAKFRNSLVGPRAPIVLPAASRMVDYEGELAVVIGTRCRSVPEADAMRFVGGYAVLNDVSARDLQRQTGQWLAGKAVDTFAPMGPGIVPAAAIEDPHALELITRLNGEVVQHASTGEMIFTIAAAISFISSVITLEPGDILATGTPAGVGSAQQPPRYLVAGDQVEVEIERIGVIVNDVIVEAHDAGTTDDARLVIGDGSR